MNNEDHEFCLRCGRKLKNPQARKIGYGAVCLRKMQTTLSKKLFEEGDPPAVKKSEERR